MSVALTHGQGPARKTAYKLQVQRSGNNVWSCPDLPMVDLAHVNYLPLLALLGEGRVPDEPVQHRVDQCLAVAQHAADDHHVTRHFAAREADDRSGDPQHPPDEERHKVRCQDRAPKGGLGQQSAAEHEGRQRPQQDQDTVGGLVPIVVADGRRELVAPHAQQGQHSVEKREREDDPHERTGQLDARQGAPGCGALAHRGHQHRGPHPSHEGEEGVEAHEVAARPVVLVALIPATSAAPGEDDGALHEAGQHPAELSHGLRHERAAER
mmetsp:Transcript_65617/g.186147  ORF Transcript_65617/g.186147 Transcript_65617/m.186147 type:complete len:268 (-) Transcript_65617:179-982(-)